MATIQHFAALPIAYGQATTVTASDTIVTGLKQVAAVVAVLEATPSLTAGMWVSAHIGDQAGTPAIGSILIKTWKPTSNADVTPLAATVFGVKVNWFAIGN